MDAEADIFVSKRAIQISRSCLYHAAVIKEMCKCGFLVTPALYNVRANNSGPFLFVGHLVCCFGAYYASTVW